MIVWPELLNILFLYLLFFSIPSDTNIRRCVLLNGVACVRVDVWTWVTCFSSCLLTFLPTSVGEFYCMVLCCVCVYVLPEVTCFSLFLFTSLPMSVGEFYWMVSCCICVDFWPVVTYFFPCLLPPLSTSEGEFHWIALCCVPELTCFSSYSHSIRLKWHKVYTQALKRGSVEVSYGRVMLLGLAAAGKTSLMHGLMNKSLPDKAESTVLASTRSIRNYWVKTEQSRESRWAQVTVKDEIREEGRAVQKARIMRWSIPHWYLVGCLWT